MQPSPPPISLKQLNAINKLILKVQREIFIGSDEAFQNWKDSLDGNAKKLLEQSGTRSNTQKLKESIKNLRDEIAQEKMEQNKEDKMFILKCDQFAPDKRGELLMLYFHPEANKELKEEILAIPIPGMFAPRKDLKKGKNFVKLDLEIIEILAPDLATQKIELIVSSNSYLVGLKVDEKEILPLEATKSIQELENAVEYPKEQLCSYSGNIFTTLGSFFETEDFVEQKILLLNFAAYIFESTRNCLLHISLIHNLIEGSTPDVNQFVAIGRMWNNGKGIKSVEDSKNIMMYFYFLLNFGRLKVKDASIVTKLSYKNVTHYLGIFTDLANSFYLPYMAKLLESKSLEQLTETIEMHTIHLVLSNLRNPQYLSADVVTFTNFLLSYFKETQLPIIKNLRNTIEFLEENEKDSSKERQKLYFNLRMLQAIKNQQKLFNSFLEVQRRTGQLLSGVDERTYTKEIRSILKNIFRIPIVPIAIKQESIGIQQEAKKFLKN